MKIFVSAYACEPGLGSEIGVGWHWVLEMSRYFELWVLTRESNRHTIEPWIANHPEYTGIHWLYYDLPQWARRWKKGLRGVRTYYNIWQMMTNSIVRRTMQENDIHVFHHLTYGNALWSVSSYGKQQTFIWGPVGGLETIPVEYTSGYSRKARIIESVRRMMVRTLPLNRGFNNRCRHADLIICKTEATLNNIPDQYRSKAILMTDVACEVWNGNGNPSTSSGQAGNGKNIVMVGRPQAWRGFDIGLEAFALALKKDADLSLTIIGCKAHHLGLGTAAELLGIADRVTFTGKVSMDDYSRLLRQADIVLIPALKEGAVTVAFDAISNGKPVVCIDSGGYTRSLTPKMSCVVDSSIGRGKVIQQLSEGLLRFTDYQQRLIAFEEAVSLQQSLCWEEKGKAIRNEILEVTER